MGGGPLKGRWALVLTLATAVRVLSQGQPPQGPHPPQGPSPLSAPFVDEEGNICQEMVELVQTVEYDNKLLCTVAPALECLPSIGTQVMLDEGPEACRMKRVKKCEVKLMTMTSVVTVRVCPGDKDFKPELMNNSDISGFDIEKKLIGRSECNEEGQRDFCSVKYETECSTVEIQHKTVEDFPNCRVEVTNTCGDNPDKFGHCRAVRAMRCTIEQREVVKSQPETRCERVPRPYCQKQDCGPTKDSSMCYLQEREVKEAVPEEVCDYEAQPVWCQLIPDETETNDASGSNSSNNLRRLRRSVWDLYPLFRRREKSAVVAAVAADAIVDEEGAPHVRKPKMIEWPRPSRKKLVVIKRRRPNSLQQGAAASAPKNGSTTVASTPARGAPATATPSGTIGRVVSSPTVVVDEAKVGSSANSNRNFSIEELLKQLQRHRLDELQVQQVQQQLHHFQEEQVLQQQRHHQQLQQQEQDLLKITALPPVPIKVPLRPGGAFLTASSLLAQEVPVESVRTTDLEPKQVPAGGLPASAATAAAAAVDKNCRVVPKEDCRTVPVGEPRFVWKNVTKTECRRPSNPPSVLDLMALNPNVNKTL